MLLSMFDSPSFVRERNYAHSLHKRLSVTSLIWCYFIQNLTKPLGLEPELNNNWDNHVWNFSQDKVVSVEIGVDPSLKSHDWLAF